MKLSNLFFLFIGIFYFLFIPTYAQNDKDEYLRLIGDQDSDFEKTSVPDKWANESAVILAEKQYYSRSYVSLRVFSRRRIKLMDKAAIENFSFFYFSDRINEKQENVLLREYFYMDSLQILVTKPNGISKLVDFTGAVKVSKDVKVPSFFGIEVYEAYKKIAIPDLEPGDVIDYCYVKVSQIWPNTFGLYYKFPPFFYVLANEYPTLKHKIEIKYPYSLSPFIEGYLSLYFRSLNGAPQIKSQALEHGNRYYLEIDTIEKVKEERWDYKFCSSPSIKGQLVFISANLFGGKTDVKKFLSPIPNGLKESISSEEVKKYMYDYFGGKLSPSMKETSKIFSKSILKYINKYHKKVIDPEEILKLSYYHFRTKVHFEKYSSYFYFKENLRGEGFMRTMELVFKKKRIPYSYVAGIKRSNGTLDDLMFDDEICFFIKPDISKPIYLRFEDSRLNLEDLNSEFQGIDAYNIKVGKKLKKTTIKKITLPISTSTKNGIWETQNYSIDENFDIVKVESEKLVRGENRFDFYNHILIPDEYETFDLQKYYDPKYTILSDFNGNKKAKADFLRKRNALYEENKTNRIEFLKKGITEDFELETYDEFKMIQDGRHYDKQDLIFQQKYKVNGLIQKVGDSYIFNAGKLIGGQVEIKEDELQRQNDIYMSTPRTFNYSITISIPEGYVLEGIDKLNFNVVKASGSFVSKAIMEGNKLKLEVSKVYNHNFEKKEEWSSMVEFLDACFDFTETKVLIKKK